MSKLKFPKVPVDMLGRRRPTLFICGRCGFGETFEGRVMMEFGEVFAVLPLEREEQIANAEVGWEFHDKAICGICNIGVDMDPGKWVRRTRWTPEYVKLHRL